jgi:hypothetical protein
MPALCAVGATVLLVAGCTSGSSGSSPAPTIAAPTPSRPASSSAPSRPASSSTPSAVVRGAFVVTVGDIACAPGDEVTETTCRQADTAKLAATFRPRYVLTLGDQQYDDGDLSDFQGSYAQTWGRFGSITKPVPGNHEYHSSDASGYFDYFRKQTTSPGYYAFDVDRWRIYALNSNCSDIDCDQEAAWLDRDMTAHPRTCTAIAMHHPRYSSDSQHGDSTKVRRFWEVAIAHHADLALAGHAHDYERFRAMDADGNVTPEGLVSFVVGTGGKSLYDSDGPRDGSVIFSNHRAGVLALDLGRQQYGWTFKDVDGKTVDSGVQDCR